MRFLYFNILRWREYILKFNSGNFEIFFPNQSILILRSLICKAFKIIPNDIKIVTIQWYFKVENPCFNFCVGDNVGGYFVINFLRESKNLHQDISIPGMHSNLHFPKMDFQTDAFSTSYDWSYCSLSRFDWPRATSSNNQLENLKFQRYKKILQIYSL